MELANQIQILLDFELLIKIIAAKRKMLSKYYGFILATLKMNKEVISKPTEILHMKNYLPVTIFHYEISAKDIRTQN